MSTLAPSTAPAVARFGGRNWTIVSALMLLVPAVPMALVIEPGTRSASR